MNRAAATPAGQWLATAGLALLLASGCTAGGLPAVTDSPPPPQPSPTATATTVEPEPSRPDCRSVSPSRVRALERLITDEQISIAKAASVRLPRSLRQERYDTLVGVVFSGPGVDGVPAVLAVGSADLTPLPVDDLARRTFTKGPARPTRSLERYRRTLAGSDTANDALICAAAA